jgi:FdhD protein
MHNQDIPDSMSQVSVLRINDGLRSNGDDLVAVESPLTIILDNQELVTVLCSPVNLKYLAVGFLFSEGLLKDKNDIKKVVIDERKGVAWVETNGNTEINAEVMHKRLITSGCGRGAAFYSFADAQSSAQVESGVKINSSETCALVNEFQHRSEVHKATHGVHSAALCDTQNMLLFSDDIGRHNAVDKIFGECILEGIQTNDRMIIVSARISSEMLLKVARKNIPVVVSIAAPTSMGVKLANDLGITLIGLVRGKRMNVYSGAWRVAD